MKTSQFMAGASRFAHFTGLARSTRAADDDQQDDEPKGKKSKAADDEDGDDDEPKGKKSQAADDDNGGNDDEPKGRKSKAADDDGGDDDEPKGKKSKRAADGDDDDDDEPKGKKSKRAADDDDDDAEDDDDKEEMHGRSAKASARLREQSRIAAILSSKAAANNIALAVSLACETRMTRQEAITVLKSQGGRGSDRDEDRGGNRHARSDRSSRNVNLGGGSESGPSGPQAVAASWGAAFAKAGIKPR